MSMFDDVALGLGRTSVMESALEPELANDDFDSVEPLDDSVDSMDFMMESAFNNELNMRNLDTAIMYNEYNYLRENGSEMVYEAGTISSIIKKAKDFVLKVWNDIQKFLAKQADRLTSKMDKMFLDKYKKNAAGQTGKAKGSLKLLDYSGIVKDANTIFGLIQDAVNMAANDIVGDNYDKKTADEYEWESFQKEVVNGKTIGEKKCETFDDCFEAMYDALKAPKDKDPIDVSADKAIDTFSNIVSSKRAIKDAYNKSKKIVNDQLKGLKKYENSTKTLKVIPTDTSSMIHIGVRTVNKLSGVLSKMNRFYCKMLNTSKSFCKAVIISAAAKGQAKGSVKSEASLIDGVQVL